MIFPEKLKRNDYIGIVSPASCEEREYIESKIHILSKLGINYKLGKSLFNKYGYFAGTDSERAADFMHMILDPEIKGIICFRGGYGSIRILNHLNYNLIKANPKIILGYSDITLLLNYISQKTGLITYHGPMINSNLTDTLTLESLKKQLYTPNNKIILDKITYNKLTILNENKINKDILTGHLIGGNLSMLCSSLGTPYEVNMKNSILLLEDIGECPYKIDRMLTQLRLSNKFKSVKAILLGHFTNCESSVPNRSFSLNETLLQNLLPLNIPLFLNIPSGHNYPNLTFPIGSNIKIDFKKKIFTIQ